MLFEIIDEICSFFAKSDVEVARGKRNFDEFLVEFGIDKHMSPECGNSFYHGHILTVSEIKSKLRKLGMSCWWRRTYKDPASYYTGYKFKKYDSAQYYLKWYDISGGV